MKNNRTLAITIGAIVLAIIAVVALVVTIVTRTGSDSTDTAAQNTTSPQEPNNTSDSDEAREVTTDLFGRRVVEDGGQPLTGEQAESGDFCSPDEQKRAPEGLEIQRVNGVATVWSETDGASRASEYEIPEGYAHTVAGAALAGNNWQRVIASGSEPGLYALKHGQHWAQDEERAQRAVDDISPEEYTGVDDPDLVPAPDAHRVVSCNDDQVVVEYAEPLPDGNGGVSAWSVSRMPMVWHDGDWKVNADDTNDVDMGMIDELDGTWVQWQY